MAEATNTSAPFAEERTFKSFTHEQGKNYAQHRLDYSDVVYQTVLEQHISTGGKLDTLADVGCGPGIVAHALSPHFTHAFGLDASEGMISSARSLGGVTSTDEPIRFEVSSAEQLGSNLSPPLADASVDLITIATAAHWIDMSRFWPRAAQVLRPGGSVAIWTSGESQVHPSMPNAAAVQAVVDAHEKEYLEPYVASGNNLAKNLYIDLPLPWTLDNKVPEFDEASYFRRTWEAGDDFMKGDQSVNMKGLEMIMSTTSPVARWREAHPDLVGTEQDVTRVLRRKIEKLLHEAGVEEGQEVLKGALGGVVMVVKKKT